jgi:hypothetical protein
LLSLSYKNIGTFKKPGRISYPVFIIGRGKL